MVHWMSADPNYKLNYAAFSLVFQSQFGFPFLVVKKYLSSDLSELSFNKINYLIFLILDVFFFTKSLHLFCKLIFDISRQNTGRYLLSPVIEQFVPS